MIEITIPVAIGHRAPAEAVSLKMKHARETRTCPSCTQRLPLREDELEYSSETYLQNGTALADFLFWHCCGGFVAVVRDRLLEHYRASAASQ